MNSSTDSGIQSSCIVEIAPLNVSHDQGNKSGFEVDIWSWCIANQFPISTINNADSENVILNIGSPHHGYTIQTKMKDGKLNGKATLKTENNTIIAEFEYQSNEIKGQCKLYYDSGELYFEGNFENGYRQGFGKEYDKNGNVIFEGRFEKGCRVRQYERMDGMEGYWKELDGNGNVISICHKNENGMNEGLCYFYKAGLLDRASIWENNEEIAILYRFEKDIMIEYKDGVKCFEGYYEGSIETGFSRVSGKEYDQDGQNVIYDGEFENGKRHGLGTSFKNNIIEYDGEWVKGQHKSLYAMVNLILPSVSWLCVSTYTFTNPLAIIVVLFLDIIYISLVSSFYFSII